MPLGLGITLTILEGGLSYHGNLGIPLEGALGLGVLTVRDWLVDGKGLSSRSGISMSAGSSQSLEEI